MPPRYWVAVGPKESWEVSLKHQVWGLNAHGRAPYYFWEVSKGDLLLFYVTMPISGVIGYGETTEKFEGGKPIWPAEVKGKKAIWPLRIRFQIRLLIPKESWAQGGVVSVDLKKRVQGGFQHVPALIANELLNQLGLVRTA